MMEADQELINLKKTRDELMKKAFNLRDELNQRESVYVKKTIIDINKLNGISSHVSTSEDIPHVQRCPKQLIILTQNISGISYNDVEKKWLRGNTWLYKAHVVMKTLSFKLELTVNQENDINKVEDINCHFVEPDLFLLNEIFPWVQSETKVNNFSSLMFAFSEYNELCVMRKKILSKLVKERYATIEKCSEDSGGIIIHLHSPNAPSVYYAEYLWTLRLKPKTKSIGHHFTIESTSNDFVAVNQDLMEEFCKSGLKKVVLEKLWSSVCSAIDAYK